MDFLEKYVPNYHINLYNSVKENDLSLFLTDLQMMFGIVKYKKDKKKLHQFVNDNQSYFSSLDYDTCNVITALLNSNKIFKEDIEIKKEGNDVCKAFIK